MVHWSPFPVGLEKPWNFPLQFEGGGGQAEQIRISTSKRASRSRSFETAVSSLDFVHRQLRQTPETPPPPPPQNDRIGQMHNRNQARWVYFLIFIQKSNILFHRAILSFVILNSIQCLVERSNTQRPTEKHNTAHLRQSRIWSIPRIVRLGRLWSFFV